ncbi:MAG: VTC domain-containing protein, partial [Bacteroidetes bacterium]|nr:VTC domain-containing protein [Bacteroidota bacterium]
DDYARVTFDSDLRFRHETEYNLDAPEDEMISCDPETAFDPGCSVILELKCYTSHVPLWMIDMIRYFNLVRRGFSKYGTGVFNVLELHRYDDASRVASID